MKSHCFRSERCIVVLAAVLLAATPFCTQQQQQLLVCGFVVASDPFRGSRLQQQSLETIIGTGRRNGRLFSSSPRVRFNNDNNNKGDGDDSSSSTMDNPLDKFLNFVASDAFSVVSGSLGLLAVVVHRWNLVLAASDAQSAEAAAAAAEALTYQTRTDLLGVFASGSVLLNGVTKLDVTTALAESVVLEGKTLEEPEQLFGESSSSGNEDLSWALESLLAATPAKTAILVSKNDAGDEWTVRSRAGVVPSGSPAPIPEKTPILDRVGSPQNSKETYLPTLQALPGRTELTYLPSNTQMAVLIPIAGDDETTNASNSVLVLGGNTAKSFTPRDIAWSRIVAERVGLEHL
mmetsp:Transcript_2935/g.6507  ORF Transcript_2935/g.6507 Transcript_2935/m.6507 type:complete len:348 (+) Transcript_2935:166-1209(+)